MKSFIIKIVNFFVLGGLSLLILLTTCFYFSDKANYYMSNLTAPQLDKQFLRDLEVGSIEYEQLDEKIEDLLNKLPDFNKGSSGPTFLGYENILLANLAKHYMDKGDQDKARSVLVRLRSKDERSLWAISQLDYLDYLENGELTVSEAKTNEFPTVYEFEQNVLISLLNKNRAPEAAKLYWQNYRRTLTKQVGVYLQRKGKIKHYEWNPSNGEINGDNVLSLSLNSPVEVDVITIKFPIKKSVYSDFKLKVNGLLIDHTDPQYGPTSFVSLNSKYLRALSQGAYPRIDGWRYGPYLYFEIKATQISSVEVSFNEIKDVSDSLWLKSDFVSEILSQAPSKHLVDLINEYLESLGQYVNTLEGSELKRVATHSKREGMARIDLPVSDFGYYQVLVVAPEQGAYTIIDEVSGLKVLEADISRHVGRLVSRSFLSLNDNLSLSLSDNILAQNIFITKSKDAPPEKLNVTRGNNSNLSLNAATGNFDMVSRNASVTFFIKHAGQYYLEADFFELLNSPRDLNFKISDNEFEVSCDAQGDTNKKIDLGYLASGYVSMYISASGVTVPDDTFHNGDKREIAMIFKKLRLVRGINNEE